MLYRFLMLFGLVSSLAFGLDADELLRARTLAEVGNEEAVDAFSSMLSGEVSDDEKCELLVRRAYLLMELADEKEDEAYVKRAVEDFKAAEPLASGVVLDGIRYQLEMYDIMTSGFASKDEAYAKVSKLFHDIFPQIEPNWDAVKAAVQKFSEDEVRYLCRVFAHSADIVLGTTSFESITMPHEIEEEGEKVLEVGARWDRLDGNYSASSFHF